MRGGSNGRIQHLSKACQLMSTPSSMYDMNSSRDQSRGSAGLWRATHHEGRYRASLWSRAGLWELAGVPEKTDTATMLGANAAGLNMYNAKGGIPGIVRKRPRSRDFKSRHVVVHPLTPRQISSDRQEYAARNGKRVTRRLKTGVLIQLLVLRDAPGGGRRVLSNRQRFVRVRAGSIGTHRGCYRHPL